MKSLDLQEIYEFNCSFFVVSHVVPKLRKSKKLERAIHNWLMVQFDFRVPRPETQDTWAFIKIKLSMNPGANSRDFASCKHGVWVADLFLFFDSFYRAVLSDFMSYF